MKTAILPLRLILCLLICSPVFLTGCRRQSVYTYTRPMIGTVINITVIAGSEEHAVKASSAAFEAIRRVEALMSPKSESSDVYRINRFAGNNAVKISGETFDVIKKSLEISALTDRAFDISFASLGHIWNLGSPAFVPPDRRSVAKLLPLFDYRNIILDTSLKTVRFRKKNVKLGLGGIAKGYAVARAMEQLKANGVTDSLVDAGGDVLVSGDRFGDPWRVGLMHPRTKSVALAFTMSDGETVATSGDYERFAEYKGVRYHHILDPSTGFPARTIASVSVICADAAAADGFSTALFVMGKEKAIEFVKAHGELKVIIIDLEMKLFASKGLKGRIVPVEKVEIEWF